MANRNLNQSGREEENVYYVGNILIDAIRRNRTRLLKPLWASAMHLDEGEYILLTLNRRRLLQDKAMMKSLLTTLSQKAAGAMIIAPLHTYVSDSIKKLGLKLPNINIMPVQNYLVFGYLANHAKAIVTDSGNVSEEATFFGIPCITINSYAEHPETWKQGTNELVGEDSEKLATALDTLQSGKWKKGSIPERWDGHTAERIVKILLGE
jgi:UDP-N-acetylglucosamine 2-epimerase